MALAKFADVPYEILIRFNFGGAHQQQGVPLGSFEGAHYITGSGIHDNKTGEIISYKPGDAQPLPRERIVELLGEKFADFEAGFRGLEVKNTALNADLQKLTIEHQALAAELAERIAQRDAAVQNCEALAAKLARVNEAIA